MSVPIRPAVPALAGLQSLMERQRSALMEGRADDLQALSAQIKLQVAQIRQAGSRAEPPPAGAEARAEIEALNQLASLNLELLQRRLVETQATLGALGQGVPTLEEAQARSTYVAAGRLEPGAPAGRKLGEA